MTPSEAGHFIIRLIHMQQVSNLDLFPCCSSSGSVFEPVNRVRCFLPDRGVFATDAMLS